ncbi:hypothetical protein, partial [Bosea thiooxidans]
AEGKGDGEARSDHRAILNLSFWEQSCGKAVLQESSLGGGRRRRVQRDACGDFETAGAFVRP